MNTKSPILWKKRWLKKHAVDIANDGLEGEEMALSESYDLVILDIMLPKKDGLAVLKSLREEGLETPVLMLTARGEVHDRVAGLDAEDDEEDDDNDNKEN